MLIDINTKFQPQCILLFRVYLKLYTVKNLHINGRLQKTFLLFFFF